MSAPLQRLQVIKGWEDGGQTHEKVFDVACSDGLAVDPATHRCPDNGARVDLATARSATTWVRCSCETLWQDPEFEPGQEAFYYVRVLENPTCRWSTWEALRAGAEPRSDLPATIQERAWSSPILAEDVSAIDRDAAGTAEGPSRCASICAGWLCWQHGLLVWGRAGSDRELLGRLLRWRASGRAARPVPANASGGLALVSRWLGPGATGKNA